MVREYMKKREIKWLRSGHRIVCSLLRGIWTVVMWLWESRALLRKAVCFFLMLAMVGILGTACLFLWGRLMADFTENCIITIIYQSLRDNAELQHFIGSIREKELYQGLWNAARSITDGSLVPAEYILGLLGLVSVFLTTINEVLSTRSHGILLREVADHFFPFHRFLQIPMYIGFTVIGGYAAKKNVGMTTALCVLGLSVCFIYSVSMAWSLVFSQRSRSRKVYRYFLHTLSLPLSLRGQTLPVNCPKLRKHMAIRREKTRHKWQNRAQKSVLDFAEYAGTQFNKSIKPLTEKNEPLERQLVGGVRRWQKAERIKKTEEQPWMALTSAFETVFRCTEVQRENQAMYVLYTKCFPGAEADAAKDYKRNVLRSSYVWERLFDAIEGDHRRARVAYLLLAEARRQDAWIFASLAGGLLHWLRLDELDNLKAESEQPLDARIDFLFQVRQAAMGDIQTRKDAEVFYKSWSELLCVAGLLLGCMEALRPEHQDKYGKRRRCVQNSISENSLSISIIDALNRDILRYAVYAYLLFSMENWDVCEEYSVYALHIVEETVCAQFKI